MMLGVPSGSKRTQYSCSGLVPLNEVDSLWMPWHLVFPFNTYHIQPTIRITLDIVGRRDDYNLPALIIGQWGGTGLNEFFSILVLTSRLWTYLPGGRYLYSPYCAHTFLCGPLWGIDAWYKLLMSLSMHTWYAWKEFLITKMKMSVVMLPKKKPIKLLTRSCS